MGGIRKRALGFGAALFFILTLKANAVQEHWVGTWAAAPQRPVVGATRTFENQTVRLIVHISVGGKRVRVKISNLFGDSPLVIGAVHIARRAGGADIDAASDRALKFKGLASTIIAAGSISTSDPVDLDVPPLSDLAVSLFFPKSATAATLHVLAQQTNYVSAPAGDSSAAAKFPVDKTITFWPFLTGVDVVGPERSASIVAFGSSTTDGDGSSDDSNHRWPDVLAERLQKTGGAMAQIGVLNEGIIGNRLLSDIESPRQAGGPFQAVLDRLGPALGEAGVKRFDRDVLEQPGVKYVVLVLGINDILFPGEFTAASESVDAKSVIEGNRQLIARAHKKGIRVIETTIPPFEDATFTHPVMHFYTPEKEAARQEVNKWVRTSTEFDGVIDFDEVLRDPDHPTKLLPKYDAGDHLHANDEGYIASGNAISLSLFRVQ